MIYHLGLEWLQFRWVANVEFVSDNLENEKISYTQLLLQEEEQEWIKLPF